MEINLDTLKKVIGTKKYEELIKVLKTTEYVKPITVKEAIDTNKKIAYVRHDTVVKDLLSLNSLVFTEEDDQLDRISDEDCDNITECSCEILDFEKAKDILMEDEMAYEYAEAVIDKKEYIDIIEYVAKEVPTLEYNGKVYTNWVN